MKKLRNQ